MRGYLLDVNVLVALAWPNHAQHAAAHEWFAKHSYGGWATCMVTQLGFVRVSSHPAVKYCVSTQGALQKLTEIMDQPGHSFWTEPTDGYANKVFLQTLPNTLTHAQVTDSYLATVAMFNQGTLATLDRDLSRTYDKYSVLVAP